MVEVRGAVSGALRGLGSIVLITTPSESPRVPRRGAYRAPLPPRPEPPPSRFSWQAVALIVFVVDLCICGWLTVHRVTSIGPVDSGLFMIPLLLLLTMPLFLSAARTATFDLGGLMALGLALRFLACFYRFDHGADGGIYTEKAAELARSYRHLNFNVDTGGTFPGSGGMRFLAGIVATITDSNAFAEFLVFTWLGFLGCYLLYRAFATALPDADHHRYALLIFLWPSLAFWPSSVGKDCWMLFTLGIAALGAARVFARRPGGYSLLVVGSLLGSIVRPHISLLALVGFGFALLIGRPRAARAGTGTPAAVAKVAGLVVMLVIGGVLLNRTADSPDEERHQRLGQPRCSRRRRLGPPRAGRRSPRRIRSSRSATWWPR